MPFKISGSSEQGGSNYGSSKNIGINRTGCNDHTPKKKKKKPPTNPRHPTKKKKKKGGRGEKK